MGRLHGLTHIRDCCVQKQTSASAHSTYTHMLASALRRYSLCDCVRPYFKRSSACELVVVPSRVPHRPHKIVCVEDLSGHFCQTWWMCHLEKPAIHGGRSNRMHHLITHTHVQITVIVRQSPLLLSNHHYFSNIFRHVVYQICPHISHITTPKHVPNISKHFSNTFPNISKHLKTFIK